MYLRIGYVYSCTRTCISPTVVVHDRTRTWVVRRYFRTKIDTFVRTKVLLYLRRCICTSSCTCYRACIVQIVHVVLTVHVQCRDLKRSHFHIHFHICGPYRSTGHFTGTAMMAALAAISPLRCPFTSGVHLPAIRKSGRVRATAPRLNVEARATKSQDG